MTHLVCGMGVGEGVGVVADSETQRLGEVGEVCMEGVVGVVSVKGGWEVAVAAGG